MNSILDVKNIGFKYTGKEFLFRNLSFSLCPGEVLSIIGPNGVGKSTLLNCLTNVLNPVEGEIIISGNNVKDIKTADFAKLVGYMRQSTDIVYDYSVIDIVLMGRSPYISAVRQPSKKDYELAKNALESMGVAEYSDRSFLELSGGEKQKVLISRIVAQSPSVIVMDEPTSALDYGNQMRTLELIKKLQSDGFAIIMTTHNPDHALNIGGKVAALGKNQKLIFGNSDDILNTETLSEIYGEKICVSYVEEFGRKVCVCI